MAQGFSFAEALGRPQPEEQTGFSFAEAIGRTTAKPQEPAAPILTPEEQVMGSVGSATVPVAPPAAAPIAAPVAAPVAAQPAAAPPQEQGFFSRLAKEPEYLGSAVKRGWNSLMMSVNGMRMSEFGELVRSFEEKYTPEQIAKDPKLRQELENRQRAFAEAAAETARLQRENERILKSTATRPETQLMLGVGADKRGWGDTAAAFGKAIISDPGSVVDLVVGSGPGSLASAAAATLTFFATRNPVVAAAVGGTGSGAIEFGNEYADNRAEGMSHEEAWKKAALKAGVVGALDAVSMRTAGKSLDLIADAIREGATKTAVKQVGKETARQAGLGGAGEAAGSVMAGKEIDPTSVLAEMVAETGQAPVEAISTRGTLRKEAEPSTQVARAIEAGVAETRFTPEGIRNEALAALSRGRTPTSIGELARTMPPPAPPGVAPAVGPGEPPKGEPTIGEPPPVAAGREEPTLTFEEAAGAPPPVSGPATKPPGKAPKGVAPAVEAIPGMPTGEELEEEEPTAKAPPVKPGFVRMYHGGSQGPDALKGPLWFTADLRDAEGWASRDPSMKIWYVDVPEKTLVEGFDVDTLAEARAQGYAPLSRLELPAEIASQRKPLTEAKEPVKQEPPQQEPPKQEFKPTQAAAALPETPTVAPLTKPKTFEPTPVNLEMEGMPTVEVPLADLKLSKDVPQFKVGATAEGIVEPLGGKFERTGVAPIQVWRRLDGSLEVISGRHRFDLAKRSGEKTIPAQIHDEAKGFDSDAAAILDAELNIRDGQGKVKDYVNYFQGSKISREEANARGLLARSLGKRAYTIADQGSEELIAALRSDQIGDEAAYYIALNAPNNARLQAVGIKAIQDGKSMNTATNMMQAVQALAGETDTTLDMFGFDDSALREAEEMAKIAAQKQREIQTRLSAISGAAKNPALAKAEGIDVRDPEAVKRRIDELKQRKAAWDNWSTNPELVSEIRAARGVAPPAPTVIETTVEEAPTTPSMFGEDLLTAPTPEELRAREAAEAERARKKAEDERKAAAEEARGDFVLTGSERAADQAIARGQLELGEAPPAETKPATQPATNPIQALEQAGFVRVPRGGARQYVDKGGQPYLTMERGPVRVAVQPNELLFVEKNAVIKGFDEGSFTLAALMVDPDARRQGLARNALQDVIKATDKFNNDLYLEPAPLDDQPMSRDQLVNFYQSLGFEFPPDSNNKVMVRKAGAEQAGRGKPAEAPPPSTKLEEGPALDSVDYIISMPKFKYREDEATRGRSTSPALQIDTTGMTPESLLSKYGEKNVRLLGGLYGIKVKDSKNFARKLIDLRAAIAKSSSQTEGQLNAMKLPDVKELAKELGSPTSGNKPQIIQGILNFAPGTIKLFNDRLQDSKHKTAVLSAVREGKPVKDEVLKDYPDIAVYVYERGTDKYKKAISALTIKNRPIVGMEMKSVAESFRKDARETEDAKEREVWNDVADEMDRQYEATFGKGAAPSAEAPAKPAAKEKEPENIRLARKELEQSKRAQEAGTPEQLTPAQLRRRRELIEYEKAQAAPAEGVTADTVVNGEKPPADLPAENRLVLMPCCDMKAKTAAPAMQLYKGVFFQTFNSNVQPGAAPQVVILSAKHGFISPTEKIEPYDQRMTQERADEMLADLKAQLDKVTWPKNIKDVLIVGGKDYQQVMRAAVADLINSGKIEPDASVNATSGGIGTQRQQLGQYLQAIPSAEPGEAVDENDPGFRGASDEEVADVASEFQSAKNIQEENGITRVFDAPKKSEVVRLDDKAKVFVKDAGYLTVEQAKQRIQEWKDHAAAQGETRRNSDKIVLSLFDLTGEWSKPWEDAGYQVYRFDIQDDPELGDVQKFSTEFFNDVFGAFEGQDIYAILAACPCTDFASSGARHFAAKDSDGRTRESVELVKQTLATIEYFKPSIWAIENPVGRIEKLTGLPPWRLSFNPNNFGDPYTKKTLLWGRFNADLPIAPVEAVEGSKMHRMYGGKSQATKNARSVTPEGFAYSFFMANNAVDHPVMAIANKFDMLPTKLIADALNAGLSQQQIEDAIEDDYYDANFADAENALRAALSRDVVDKYSKLLDEQPQIVTYEDGDIGQVKTQTAEWQGKISRSEFDRLVSFAAASDMQRGKKYSILLADTDKEVASITMTARGLTPTQQQVDVVMVSRRSTLMPPETQYTPAQREQAQKLAEDVGGEIVWQRGDNALIRGYSALSGDPVYIPTMGDVRARVDVESFTGKQLASDVKQEMIAAKQEIEAAAARKHQEAPFITFQDGLAMSPDIPEQLAGVIKDWKSMLKLDVPIYISTIEDARANRNNFTGPHRRIGSGTLSASELGSMRMMPDGSYYILFTKSTSPTKMLETIAHEMGHVHQRVFYERATPAEREALRDAHSKWLEEHKGKTAQELIDSMRARSTGRAVKIREGMPASELGSYWSLFGEWYADQTARWAMSSERPVSIVEKYFKRLGIQLRRFFQQLQSKKYLPNETFAQYMERATESPANLEPTKKGGTPLANIEQPTPREEAETLAVGQTREEQIKEYAKLRAAMGRVLKRVAAGKAGLETQRTLTETLQRARDLQVSIKLSAPRRDSAEKFLAKALTEYDNGNISQDVLDVIQTAYAKQPELLEGLLLSVKMPGEGQDGTAGQFIPWSRIVRLFKETSGTYSPQTIRHELAHSLEQMMTPEQRIVVVQAWGKALARAIKQNPDELHQKYFNAILNFLDKPTEANLRAAQRAMPSYEMYQFINPSEFWAVNAEKLMASQLGTSWDRFKKAVRQLFEGLKKVLGFDNRYDVHKVFSGVMRGSRERMTEDMLVDMVKGTGGDFITLDNLQDDRDLLDKYQRPHTPMLDTTPVKTFITRQFKNGKEMFADAIDNPKEAMIGAGDSVVDGVLYLRNKNVWYGAGLESRDFDRYNGQLRTSEGIVTASVALDNAIRSGNIGVEVIFRGGIEYSASAGNFIAVERRKGMRGVYEAQHALMKRLGDQMGTDIIQGYLEAKRSISIMDELYEREAELEDARQNLEAMRANNFPPEEIAQAVAMVADREEDVASIKKAVSSVGMSEEEMYEFAALDQRHPELRKIMDNWNAVNQNLLKFWRQVGLLSQGRYETLAAIKDYVPWYRIMNDEEDVHSPIQSTTRAMTNIGREKLFKRGKPIAVVDFRAKEGQQDFKIQPSSVVKVEVNGEKVDPDLVSATPSGEVHIDMELHENDLVVFSTNREIENIIDNMTRNVMRMTMNGLRQFAANRIVLEYASRNDKGKIMVFPSVEKEKGRFNWVVNGKKVVVEIQDPLVASAVYGMDNINLQMWAPLAAVANLTRRAITLSGAFQIKQVFKDAPTAALVTGVKNPLALIGGVWKGFLTSLTNTDPAVDILKAAGIGGFHSPARTPEAEIKRRLGIMNRNVFDFVIKGLDHIGDASDMAQRVAVYKRVMKETGDETQALYQAANVINFLHHGSAGYAQAIVKVVPFMGAYANSMDVLINALMGGGLKGMERQKALARLGITMSLLIGASLLYAMLAGADPDYDELDDQTKLKNIIIPGTKIVLPMNTSAAYFFKAIPELTYNAVTRQGTDSEMDRRRIRKALGDAARDMLLGPEPIPAGVKPLLEVAIDHSFYTGRNVIPEGLKNVEAAEQYTASTSELAKKLSAMLEIPGTDGKRVLSPIEADHIIRGTLGAAGAMGQWISNSIGAIAQTRPEPTAREAPVIGAFLREEVPRGREDLFYDFKEAVFEKYQTWKKMIDREDFEAADAYLEKHGDIAGMYRYINQTEDALKDINAEIRRLGETRQKDLTPKERRVGIAELQQVRQEILEPVRELRREVLR